MCRYCKKLKELNALREKNLTDCIKYWKRRDLEARTIISLLIEFADEYGEDTSYVPISEFERCESVLSRAHSFLDTNYI